LVSAVVCAAAVCGAATPEHGTNAFESPTPPKATSQIDQLVFAQLARLNIQPVLCSDAVFVRRAYIDVLGTVPTAQEAKEFIQDPDAENKRRLLIDSLLERSEFADYWAMKWGDVLRIKAEFPVNLWPNAAQVYHHWVKASITANKPYDKFARELLTSSGSNFRVGPVNFYRAIQDRTPEGIARAVALTLMGARAEAWPSNRLANMTAFFSEIGYKPTGEWKEEHVFWDPLGESKLAGNTAPGRAAIASIANPTNYASQAALVGRTNNAPTEAIFPDGTRVKLSPDRDPREVFADWLITPQNPWFTRSIVNRVWAWLLGRGIIQEPDDIRADNPPSNPALLAYLEKEMIASHYDLKALYRLILNSETYQLSSMPRFNTPEATANFASYPLRRLDAEVLIDAINKVTGSSDLYTSPIPEPFTFIPKGMPAVAIADGSITSPFLALFGRSARATGMANERNNKPTPAQWLYLLNSTEVQRKLEQGPNLQAILNSGRKPADMTEVLYLTILSRFPTPEELKIVQEYKGAQPAKPAQGAKAGGTKPGSTNSAAAKSAATNAVPAAKSPQSTNQSLPATVGRSNTVAVKSNTPPRPGALGSLGPRSKPSGKTALPKRRDEWMDIVWSMINSEEFMYRH
jgi:Protein of unknown function (DUF1553)/Protein of unknown function (DUF1549)